jgi:trimeric autotransporter adhesin
LATDAFSRTVDGGWGAADTGGAWSMSGATSRLSVNGDTGIFALDPGWTLRTWLDGVSSLSNDVASTVSVNQVPSGTGTWAWVYVQARRVSETEHYGARLRLGSDGSVQLHVTAGNGTPVAGVVVPGLTLAAGDQLRVRVQADGSNPTTLRAKVWKAGTAEPDWQVTKTDATPTLQVPGSVGFQTYLSRSATNDAFAVAVDDLTAEGIG